MTRRRPGRCSVTAWRARRFSSARPRPPNSSACAIERPRPGQQRGGALSDRAGTPRAGIGIALAWHGAGFTGSGEVRLASVAAVELTGDGRIEILTGSTEMGQGTKTIFPQLVADALGVEYDDVEIAPQDTALVPDSGPTVASRRWWSAGC